MPRKKEKEVRRPNHRPLKEIDWDLVDSLLEAGCEGTQIAPYFNMHPHTLYLRVEQQYGVTFTEYQSYKRSLGDSFIVKKQYDKALSGDNTMLIYVGKTRLKQSEDPRTLAQIKADKEEEFIRKKELIEYELQRKQEMDSKRGVAPNDIAITDLLASIKALK